MNKPSDVLKIRESVFYNKCAKDDIKIASIGDIHISRLVGEKDINNVCESLFREDPDYICLLGDLIDSPKELTIEKSVDDLNTLMKSCSDIAPTMVVLGSHDCNNLKNLNLYDGSNVWGEINKLRDVYVLNDDVYSDKRIIIGGYIQKEDAYSNPNDAHRENPVAFYNDFIKHPNLYDGLKEDIPKVLITHSPETIRDSNVEELLSLYDVIITGHYHNGCVPAMLENIYPKNAGIITPKLRLFPKEARGVVKLDNGTYLIYSGGWIKLSAGSPLIFHPLDKICNRQIDITTLTSDEEYIKESVKTKKLVLKK